jgi:cephalosporin hydroxylase
MNAEVRKIYNSPLNTKSRGRWYSGHNLLGWPTLADGFVDGTYIGWMGNTLKKNGIEVPVLQLKPDMDKNFPMIFDTFKPTIVLDFGTAGGGSAVYFYDTMKKYCDPKVFSIDISLNSYHLNDAFHIANKTEDTITLIEKGSLDCVEEIRKILSDRKEEDRVLISFDDDHSYEHTYQELSLYAPLLKRGDMIIMQDTVDQGLFGHETSPLLAVWRYVKEHPSEVQIREDILTKMVMPSNFIYGVIEKK